MSRYVLGETPNVFDPDTGRWIGVVDRNGIEQAVPTFAPGEAVLRGSDGGVVALSEAIGESLANPSATTTVLTGPGEYFAYRCTVAAGNITVYDNTSATGKVLVPTTALTVGVFPIFGAGVSRSLEVSLGITVVLSGAATVYVSRRGY